MEKVKTFIIANQVYIIGALVIGVVALGYKIFIHDKK